MTHRTVHTPVRVVDNGVRSFLPPTFCFELWDETGALVATVSQVVLADQDDREMTDFEALGALHGEELRAVGRIDPYDAGPGAPSPGARFTVTGTAGGPR
ncbi:hypothetical protein [Streptomyces iconiensis]|uniref:Uncharacterized protein n=1 Tax=Streptomyces iconiensis TaxID=1384038 RepID=A0ABT7A118_9ACTN|nr:hypothetical protein [Streptomyces iconiensis]MDJ1135010.1 hypothetical protein [Streptomyces iconiensis]